MELYNYTSLRNKIFKPTNNSHQTISVKNGTPEILFISSFPSRECGIATYSQDLVSALNNKFNTCFKLKICPIESNSENFDYDFKVPFALNSEEKNSYQETSKKINQNPNIKIVLLQHEFGFFEKNKTDLIELLVSINKPIIIVFHTILKKPNQELKTHVKFLAKIADALIVMTNFSKEILVQDYEIETTKINVIAHGTHLIPNSDKSLLKEKYQLSGKQVLSTFGLLSSGKSIETTLFALPKIVKENPNVLFLILGKTHPGIVKNEGEKYRDSLEKIIKDLKMEKYVRFVNDFLPLPELLDYLQLTDIYLFTSKDPNQAVSGTFSYAISCGCPIISTPIPHAVEVITEHIGRIIPFEDSDALALEVNLFLRDKVLIKQINLNCLHKMASTAWENSAIAHAQVFQKVSLTPFQLEYNLPKINLNHIHKMTTEFAMIQFSIINQADINSGYTLDDNARAMVALCQHYELTKDESDLSYIALYLDFICFCMQEEGYFLNYVGSAEKVRP
jgi:glycosyltransferase involved in cell wall biosynthesis